MKLRQTDAKCNGESGHHAGLTTGSIEKQTTTQLQNNPMHCTTSLLALFTYKLIKVSS